MLARVARCENPRDENAGRENDGPDSVA